MVSDAAQHGKLPPTGNMVMKATPEIVRLSDVLSLPVSWMWRPYLAFGMVSMLSGDPDAGKTFIALAIAADLSNGRVPVSDVLCTPIATLYLSHENAPEYVIRPRFDALGGNASLFHLLKGSVIESNKGQIRSAITLKEIGLLEAALHETGARLIVIDPIQSYLGADVDAHRSNETRPIMDGLIGLAERFNVCVLLVRHLSKASIGRAIHRGLGSIDLTGSGHAYVTGTAYSTNFPVTKDAFHTVNHAAGVGASNAFVTKLTFDGTALHYSTYLGGSGVAPVELGFGDGGGGIAVDTSGNAYVTGT